MSEHHQGGRNEQARRGGGAVFVLFCLFVVEERGDTKLFLATFQELGS